MTFFWPLLQVPWHNLSLGIHWIHHSVNFTIVCVLWMQSSGSKLIRHLITFAQNQSNSKHWSGFVKKSSLILLVGQCLMSSHHCCTWSFMKKYLMFRCHVYWLDKLFQFTSSNIVLLLFKYKTTYGVNLCASMKWCTQVTALCYLHLWAPFK